MSVRPSTSWPPPLHHLPSQISPSFSSIQMDSNRPTKQSIRSKWLDFFSDPLLSPTHIKQCAFQGRLSGLRSLYWRIFLGQLPAPSAPNPKIDITGLPRWSIALEQSRVEWEVVRKRFLRAPDGKWVADSADWSATRSSGLRRPSITHSSSIDSQMLDLGVNNPLSQHEANPWNVWLGDLELRKIIQQDVDRTFPEIHYFRQPHIQTMLTNILHVYCKIHDDIGYRQGMHELLAVVLQTLDMDSLACPSEQDHPDLMYQVLAREFIEHDAYSLFSMLMRPMKSWYDFNSSVPVRNVANSQTSPWMSVGFLPPQLAPALPQNPAPTSATLVHPIVDKCAKIFHVYLKQADFELWSHLDKMEIEPQLWGIRWLRLLFTREFSYEDSLILWDAIFAEDPSGLRLVDFICIAMLLRIRDSLLDSDYSGALQLILRYPRPADGESKLCLLVYQALLLAQFPTPQTASLIYEQNLNLKASAGELSGTRDSEPDPRSNLRSRRFSSQTTAEQGPRRPKPSSSLNMEFSSSAPVPNDHHGRMGDFARVIQRKAEGQGKNKTILGALAELRWGHSPTSTTNGSHRTGGLPASSPHQPLNSTVASHITSPTDGFQNASSDHLLSELRKSHVANREVGTAIGLCVDALEASLSKMIDPVDSTQGLVLGALKHIRDIMESGFSSGFDPDMMGPLIEYRSGVSETPSGAPAQDRTGCDSDRAAGSAAGAAEALDSTHLEERAEVEVPPPTPGSRSIAHRDAPASGLSSSTRRPSTFLVPELTESRSPSQASSSLFNRSPPVLQSSAPDRTQILNPLSSGATPRVNRRTGPRFSPSTFGARLWSETVSEEGIYGEGEEDLVEGAKVAENGGSQWRRKSRRQSSLRPECVALEMTNSGSGDGDSSRVDSRSDEGRGDNGRKSDDVVVGEMTAGKRVGSGQDPLGVGSGAQSSMG